jgi:hypothetical protein
LIDCGLTGKSALEPDRTADGIAAVVHVISGDLSELKRLQMDRQAQFYKGEEDTYYWGITVYLVI